MGHGDAGGPLKMLTPLTTRQVPGILHWMSALGWLSDRANTECRRGPERLLTCAGGSVRCCGCSRNSASVSSKSAQAATIYQDKDAGVCRPVRGVTAAVYVVASGRAGG